VSADPPQGIPIASGGKDQVDGSGGQSARGISGMLGRAFALNDGNAALIFPVSPKTQNAIGSPRRNEPSDGSCLRPAARGVRKK